MFTSSAFTMVTGRRRRRGRKQPAMRTRYIPDDVWTQIARYIPLDHLKSLLTINRPFFNSAMNARYHTVELFSLDLNTFKLLMRLQSVILLLLLPAPFTYDQPRQGRACREARPLLPHPPSDP
jgi:hypothetical protein